MVGISVAAPCEEEDPGVLLTSDGALGLLPLMPYGSPSSCFCSVF